MSGARRGKTGCVTEASRAKQRREGKSSRGLEGAGGLGAASLRLRVIAARVLRRIRRAAVSIASRRACIAANGAVVVEEQALHAGVGVDDAPVLMLRIAHVVDGAVGGQRAVGGRGEKGQRGGDVVAHLCDVIPFASSVALSISFAPLIAIHSVPRAHKVRHASRHKARCQTRLRQGHSAGVGVGRQHALQAVFPLVERIAGATHSLGTRVVEIDKGSRGADPVFDTVFLACWAQRGVAMHELSAAGKAGDDERDETRKGGAVEKVGEQSVVCLVHADVGAGRGRGGGGGRGKERRGAAGPVRRGIPHHDARARRRDGRRGVVGAVVERGEDLPAEA
ncbi:hypothetical protein FA09DRAFT_250864 [Tilletiopsis washingtonensis]|uniref:Uncharacterized protein n=1 Tax=Tilletiopsis washingtonensis TaxID=58919 RepID=A0A316ZCL9_9BASI|nr:hypothetical protein FA09DRAFT_250864 [Tilletiopsis washingtonensis]PWN98764.1 hypothetical protein FA09DRAFT_250864 [Tilletiopsis washingtonensis]